jgi:CBS domain-containing protein
METQWAKFLRESTVKNVVKTDKKLVTINASQKIPELLQLLKTHNIQGVPVLDNGKLLGLVDSADVLTYALKLWRRHEKPIPTRGETPLGPETEAGRKFLETPIRDIINISGRDELVTLSENSTLKDVFDIFWERDFKPRRLLITNDKREPSFMLSKRDIIEFASKFVNTVPLSDHPLKELNILHTPLFIRHDAMLIDALNIISDNRISGLALVDWENKLVANFGASDLKGSLPELFTWFYKPTLDYVRSGTVVKSKIPPVTATTNSKLSDLITTFSKENVHRIFVVNNENKLVSVVTCTDILRYLGSNNRKQATTTA